MNSTVVLRISLVLSATLPLCALPACSRQAEAPSPHYDFLIVNGEVYDGSTGPARRTNIGIVDERIESMEAPADATAHIVLDATGRVVVPGFIDPHTHAGGDLLSDEHKANVNYLTQGVTTVFIGNDGSGVPDLAESLATLRRQGIGTNVAFFAGHGDVRRTVMGLENRAATDDELARMLELTEAQMRAGAVGLSTGLYYTPGIYAGTDEVVAITRVAARFGGVYDSHIRDESSYSIGLLGAVQEVIDIAEATGIPVHLSHLKALGRDVWGQSGDVIAMVDAARARGLEVTANQYPYRAGGTRFSAALIPAWVRADSEEAMFDRLANADLADRIRTEMEQNLERRGGPTAMLVTEAGSSWRGMTLEEIAGSLQTEPLDAAIAVVRQGDPSIASFTMQTEDIHAIAIQEWTMTGSDGSGGHPRKFATYPKVYRDMVLGAGLFPMERFVHRSAGLVADTFNLCDRGYLAVGRKADIVLIDLDAYRPVADYENPTALSTGVTDVFINGRPVIRGGELTGLLPGAVIDRQHQECPAD